MSGNPKASEPDMTVSVAVVYDSGSRRHPALGGRTRVLAEAVARGAEAVDGTVVALIPVTERDDHWEALDAADAIVFGCPTYMGSGSAALKAFMEETLRPRFLEQRWKDKLAAGFTNSAGMSGDKLLSLQQLAGFAAQHGMIWVTLGQLPGWQTLRSAHRRGGPPLGQRPSIRGGNTFVSDPRRQGHTRRWWTTRTASSSTPRLDNTAALTMSVYRTVRLYA